MASSHPQNFFMLQLLVTNIFITETMGSMGCICVSVYVISIYMGLSINRGTPKLAGYGFCERENLPSFEMDENWRYPYFRKPSYLRIYLCIEKSLGHVLIGRYQCNITSCSKNQWEHRLSTYINIYCIAIDIWLLLGSATRIASLSRLIRAVAKRQKPWTWPILDTLPKKKRWLVHMYVLYDLICIYKYVHMYI